MCRWVGNGNSNTLVAHAQWAASSLYVCVCVRVCATPFRVACLLEKRAKVVASVAALYWGRESTQAVQTKQT